MKVLCTCGAGVLVMVCPVQRWERRRRGHADIEDAFERRVKAWQPLHREGPSLSVMGGCRHCSGSCRSSRVC